MRKRMARLALFGIIIGGSVGSAAAPAVITSVTSGGAGSTTFSGVTFVHAEIAASVGGGNSSSWSYLYIRFDANDGGLLNFRFRIQDENFCGPCYQTYFLVTDTPLPPASYSGAPLLSSYDWIEVSKPFGPGKWSTEAEYVFEVQPFPLRRNEQTLVVAVQGGGTNAKTVDVINAHVVACGLEAASGTRRHVEADQFTGAAQSNASAQCNGCCVASLSELTDAEAIEFENGKKINTDKLTEEMQTASICFEGVVAGDGGNFSLTSAYRPPQYQAHLKEIWTKVEALKKEENAAVAACQAIKLKVVAEKAKHGLVFQPASASGPHTRGEAIDVKIQPEATGLTLERLLELADGCDLYRRVPADKVHFEHK